MSDNVIDFKARVLAKRMQEPIDPALAEHYAKLGELVDILMPTVIAMLDTGASEVQVIQTLRDCANAISDHEGLADEP